MSLLVWNDRNWRGGLLMMEHPKSRKIISRKEKHVVLDDPSFIKRWSISISFQIWNISWLLLLNHNLLHSHPNLQCNGSTLKLLCVYTLVNSRLFSHQVVSQGNIYYPITTSMPMSPMCEAVFTWLCPVSSWKTLWLCSPCRSPWDTGAISQTFPITREASWWLFSVMFP